MKLTKAQISNMASFQDDSYKQSPPPANTNPPLMAQEAPVDVPGRFADGLAGLWDRSRTDTGDIVEAIRYKVVNKLTHGSCNVQKRYKKYHKTYKKGKVVKMAPGSFGLMVFRTRRQVEDFCQERLFTPNSCIIIRVEPTHKALKRPKWIFFTHDLRRAYKKWSRELMPYNSFEAIPIPDGTLFYKAVKVLD